MGFHGAEHEVVIAAGREVPVSKPGKVHVRLRTSRSSSSFGIPSLWRVAARGVSGWLM
jgi:hypothetical protein